MTAWTALSLGAGSRNGLATEQDGWSRQPCWQILTRTCLILTWKQLSVVLTLCRRKSLAWTVVRCRWGRACEPRLGSGPREGHAVSRWQAERQKRQACVLLQRCVGVGGEKRMCMTSLGVCALLRTKADQCVQTSQVHLLLRAKGAHKRMFSSLDAFRLQFS